MSLFGRNKTPKTASAGRAAGPTLVFEMADRILYEAEAATLAERPIVIGRDKSCDWCTSGIDASVSSRHAELFRKRGAIWIRDLGSRNGLFYRGERIKERRLAIGDSILIGACKVTLEPPRAAVSGNGLEHHRLEQINGPEAGRVFELVGETDAVIGSDPASDIFIPDTLVSRRHAKLAFKKDGSCWISDLGSRNGTLVDGTPVVKDKERLLRDGNVLSVAYVEFRFLDKGAVHVRANIGRKLLVAAATVTASILGFSVWDVFRVDAGTLLARAGREAERWSPESKSYHFAPAFALLDQAAVARHADAYMSNITELKERMASWTNTITGWQKIRSLLDEGKWVSSQEQFHLLSSWTWNATSAAEAHREAEAVQELVNAFLAARADIRQRAWESNRDVETFRADESRLAAALRNAPSPDICPWMSPLSSEASELKREFVNTLERLSAVPEALSCLSADDVPHDAAALALARINALLEEDKAHELARVAEIANTNFPYRSNANFPYHAPVVAARLGEVREPLQVLAAAERQIDANIEAIAAGRWGDVRPELEIPSRELTDLLPAFMSYRERLESMNARLCGIPGRSEGIMGDFRSRMESMEKCGFGPFLSSRPSAFDILLDDATLSRALEFVDASVPLPAADAAAPVCPYDSFVGIFELGDFLADLAGGDSPDKAVASYAAAWRESPWKGVVQEVRELLVLLRRFRRFPGEDRTGLVRLVLAARPDGGNRCAEAVRNAGRLLDSISDWCEEDLAEACENDASERAQIFGEAVALLMMDDDELRGDAAARRAEKLSNRWRNLQKRLREVARRAEVDPDAAWREVLSLGLPVNAAPFKGAWRYLHEQYERGGAK